MMVDGKRWDFSDFDVALIDEMLGEGLGGGQVTGPSKEAGETVVQKVLEVLTEEPMLVAGGPTALACTMLYMGIAIGREQERQAVSA